MNENKSRFGMRDSLILFCFVVCVGGLPLMPVAEAKIPKFWKIFSGERPKKKESKPAVKVKPDHEICYQTGPQKFAIVYVDTGRNSERLQRRPESAVKELFKGPRSFDSYIREQSSGHAYVERVDVVKRMFIPEDRICAKGEGYPELLNMVRAQLDANTMKDYNRLVLIYPRLSCGEDFLRASLGCQTIEVGGVTQKLSVMWYPIFESDDDLRHPLSWRIGALTHELGHNFALDHRMMETFDGEPLGPEGKKGTIVENNRSPFTPVGSGSGMIYYSAPDAVGMGWIQGDEISDIETSQDVRVLPRGAREPGLKVLRIRRGSKGASRLWLEFRKPIGDFEGGLIEGSQVCTRTDGAVIYNESGTTLDFSPGQADIPAQCPFGTLSTKAMHDRSDLVLKGRWSDPYSDLNLEVLSADAAGLHLRITYGRR